MIEFDNVFRVEMTDEYVKIYVGKCDSSLLRADEEVSVPEDKVSDVKELVLGASTYLNFMNMAVTVGYDLQRKHGIDLGFRVEDGEQDEEDGD